MVTPSVLNLLLADLESLLWRAGFGGEYKLIVTGKKVRGSAEKAGLTIGAPCARGIQLYGQYGDNGSRMTYILASGLDEDQRNEMCEKLRETQQRLQEAPQKQPAKRGSEELCVERESVPLAPIGDSAPDSEFSMRGFTTDPENVALVCDYLADRADETGQVTRQICNEVIMEVGGAQNQYSAGQLRRRLLERGHLVRVEQGKDLFRLADTFLKESPERVDHAPVEAAKIGQKLLRRKAELEEAIARASTLDERLAGIRAKRADLARLISTLRQKLTEHQDADTMLASEAERLKAEREELDANAEELAELKRFVEDE